MTAPKDMTNVELSTLKVGDWFWRKHAAIQRPGIGLVVRDLTITWHIRRIGDINSTVWIEGSDGTHLFLEWDDWITFCKDAWR